MENFMFFVFYSTLQRYNKHMMIPLHDVKNIEKKI